LIVGRGVHAARSAVAGKVETVIEAGVHGVCFSLHRSLVCTSINQRYTVRALQTLFTASAPLMNLSQCANSYNSASHIVQQSCSKSY
jgi:hypothetical protein